MVDHASAGAGIDRGAINVEAVGLGPLAVSAQVDAVLGGEDVTGRLRVGLAAAGGQSDNARRKHDQGHEIAANQGQVRDFHLLDLA